MNYDEERRLGAVGLDGRLSGRYQLIRATQYATGTSVTYSNPSLCSEGFGGDTHDERLGKDEAVVARWR